MVNVLGVAELRLVCKVEAAGRPLPRALQLSFRRGGDLGTLCTRHCILCVTLIFVDKTTP